MLDAVRRQLSLKGYAAVTPAAVATLAGVDRATVGRRWPSKAQLVIDAGLELAEDAPPVTVSGDLDRDLRLLARRVAAALGDLGTRRLIAGFIAARAEDPELDDLISRFWANRFGAVRDILDGARDCPDTSAARAETVVEVLVAPMYFRAFISGRPIDDALIEKSAAQAAAAARC